MIIEYYNLDKNFKKWNSEFPENQTELIIGKQLLTIINRINISNYISDVRIIKELIPFFDKDPLGFTSIELYNSNHIIGFFNGFPLYIHSPEFKYISIFNDISEIARIYLIDKSEIRSKRLDKILNK